MLSVLKNTYIKCALIFLCMVLLQIISAVLFVITGFYCQICFVFVLFLAVFFCQNNVFSVVATLYCYLLLLRVFKFFNSCKHENT